MFTGTHTVGIGNSITGDDKLLVAGDVGVTGSYLYRVLSRHKQTLVVQSLQLVRLVN